MIKIITQIKESLKLQGISETKLAEKAGLPQKTVNNLLAGRTKRLDPEVISKLLAALGIVSDQTVQDMTPDPARMTTEDKIRWIGLPERLERLLLEQAKLPEEEQSEELKRIIGLNIDKGRF